MSRCASALMGVAPVAALLLLGLGGQHWAFVLGGRHNFQSAGSLFGCSSAGSHRLVSCRAGLGPEEKAGRVGSYIINDQIQATEVRIVEELSAESGEMEDVNDVMLFREALARARDRGLDLILINKETDPPICKIAAVSKFAYAEDRKKQEKAKLSKTPDIKEVKMSYTIGDHDLNAKLGMVEKWVQNPKQQVKVIVQMKGRTKMFEKQARDLLTRVRREVASYAKVPGSDRGLREDEIVSKDGRGDLQMLLSSGPDRKILKELLAEAGQDPKQLAKAEAANAVAAKSGGDEDDEEEDEEEEEEEKKPAKKKAAEPEDNSPTGQAIQKLKAEMEELKQDLLEAGVKPGQINQQPEMKELLRDLAALQAKVAAKAFGSETVPRLTAGIFVGGAVAALSRPRRLR